MALLAVEEALSRILTGLPHPESEVVSIEAAYRRVLAEDLPALLTQPPFDASAMDGYAVRSEDATLGARLRVIGAAQAGLSFSGDVRRGEAVRIFTGAPIPMGADTIVIQENVDRDGDVVVINQSTSSGAHVRRAGMDFTQNSVALKAGRTLDAHAVTLAAAMGYGELPVAKRPLVAILATGDELVTPGTVPGPDQIVSSNSIGIAALVQEAGGEPRSLGIARDKQEDLAVKIAEARNADILVTIGGASEGDHDLVAHVLRAEGMTLGFWKIAMRPGKPLLFGQLGPTRVLGLPGNPVSALICARVFLTPLVRALAGRTAALRHRTSARLTTDLKANGPRMTLLRATHEHTLSGEVVTTPLPSQDSSLLSALVAATCLIRRPPHDQIVPAGTLVEIELI